MFISIIRKIDMVNVFFAIIVAIALIWNEREYIQALILLISAISLLITKYKYSKASIFISYTCSLFFFGILLTKLTEVASFQSIMLPTNVFVILLISIIIAFIASYIQFGSGTLTIVWFILHLLMIGSTIHLSESSSLLAVYWSNEAQTYTIHSFYPFLLAGMLIGIYLEKYQIAIKREKNNN